MKIFSHKNKKSAGPPRRGFTIIEVMIAIALFTIIITIGIGSLLNANDIHKKTAKVRSIMDNLNFIMEDMSRNLRTGTLYKCASGSSSISADNCNAPNNINVLSFQNNNVFPVEQWVYSFGGSNIYKSTTGSLTDAVQLNPDEVQLDPNSGFVVSGAKLGTADNLQPYVIIKLSGTIFYKSVTVTTFSLETSVSQRAADVSP